ncbi:MAG: cupin domain-containing protein [Candidatus Nomurabacteria bacterium]|nr:cupin domain-containing protein [Candidatus Nomurabacteria bacterium]
MEILHRRDGIFSKKIEGTEVTYHLFDEFEVHENEVPPGTIQSWHHHDIIEEILYIISGSMKAHWKDGGKEFKEKVRRGDVIRVGNLPHNFVNTSNRTCRFVVFRFVPTGESKKDLIKNDKILD